MTTRSQAREAVYNQFISLWLDRTPYLLDNSPGSPPNENPEEGSVSWVRLSVRHTNEPQGTFGSVGNRRFERNGFIVVQVFTPLNSNLQGSDELIEGLQEIFEATKFSNIYSNNSNSQEIGNQGRWFLTLFQSDLFYEQIK